MIPHYTRARIMAKIIALVPAFIAHIFHHLNGIGFFSSKTILAK
jgi:hypothetical protein